MNYRTVLVSIVCSLILAGCDVKTEANIYLSDILTVAKTGQPEKVNVRYLIEVPTRDKCKLYGQRISDIIKPQMPELTNVSCERSGIQDFVVITGSTSLVRATPNDTGDQFKYSYPGVSALGIRIQDGSAVLDLVLATSVFENLATQTKQVLDSELFDAHISKIEITLDNDTKNDFRAVFAAATVDGDPVIQSAATFKSHTKRVIIASNVHSKALEKNGHVGLFAWDQQ